MSLTPTPQLVYRAVSRWAVESQARARRNAMVAMTALSERRAEREDVEDYLRGAATRGELERPGGVAVPRPRASGDT